MQTIDSRMKWTGEEIYNQGLNDVFMIIIGLSDVSLTDDCSCVFEKNFDSELLLEVMSKTLTFSRFSCCEQTEDTVTEVWDKQRLHRKHPV